MIKKKKEKKKTLILRLYLYRHFMYVFPCHTIVAHFDAVTRTLS